MTKMWMTSRGLLVALCLAVLLAGCGGGTGGGSGLAGTPNPAQPQPSPTVAATAGYPTEAEVSVAAAKSSLAQVLKVSIQEVGVVSVEDKTWSDSDFGCSRYGRPPMDITTPGYRIILSVKGKQYEYHTDKVGKVVPCSRTNVSTGSETPSGATSTVSPTYPAGAGPVVTAAEADLAKTLNIDVRAITVVKVEEHEWSDEALGCGPPLAHPVPVPRVPGYLITLAAGGTTYGYHADKNGKISICSTK